MKTFKKILLIVLTAMLCIPNVDFTTVLASENPTGVKVEMNPAGSREDGKNVYTLDFEAKAEHQFLSFTTFFSMDDTKIQPVNQETKEDVTTNIGVNGESELPLEPVARDDANKKLTIFSPTWFYKDNRRGYSGSFKASSKRCFVSNGEYITLFRLHFRLKDGVTLNDIDENFFRFENGSDPHGFFSDPAMYPVPPSASAGICLQVTNGERDENDALIHTEHYFYEMREDLASEKLIGEVSFVPYAQMNAEISQSSFVYTGSSITPENCISVNFAEKSLTNGTDYTLSYENNRNVGTAVVTVTGQGAYAGQTTQLSFEITKCDVAISAGAYTKRHKEDDPIFVPILEPELAAGDSIIAGSLKRNSGEDVDTYTITQNTPYDLGGNYNITGFTAGTLTIEKTTPTANDLEYDLPKLITYSGEPETTKISKKPEITGMEQITVKYNGSLEAPTNVGSYSVSADIDGTNYEAATIELGTLTIIPAVPFVTGHQELIAYLAQTLENVDISNIKAWVDETKTKLIDGVFSWAEELTTNLGTVLENKTNYTLNFVSNCGNYIANGLQTIINLKENPENIDTPITLKQISAITMPTAGEEPVTSFETDEYTGTVTWTPNMSIFEYNKVYTATVIITPKQGFTLEGVEANSFVIEGATSTVHSANSGMITAAFPLTNKMAPTLNLFVYDLSQKVFNGLPQSVLVTPQTQGLGTIVVKYSGSEKIPTEAGTYIITLHIAEGSDYGAADLTLGSFVIVPAEQVVKFFIYYHDNNKTGGSAPIDNNPYTLGAEVQILGNTGSLARHGYDFMGWAEAPNSSTATYKAGDKITLNSNVNLYPVWKERNTIEYTDADTEVIFSASGGSLPNNAKITVTLLNQTALKNNLPEEVKEKIYSNNIYVYEIEAFDENHVKITKFEEPITLYFPIPEEFIQNAESLENIVAYYFDNDFNAHRLDEKFEIINSRVYCFITTDHLSKFGIIDERKPANKDLVIDTIVDPIISDNNIKTSSETLKDSDITESLSISSADPIEIFETSPEIQEEIKNKKPILITIITIIIAFAVLLPLVLYIIEKIKERRLKKCKAKN